ncbi:hypothetical protein GOP47_0016390 [Adiantum capillus-veneris]|uniref:Uncharacterized protein n=1 Tax=Adiantum capillus-veneris TaxID=13818 RepID=A0A9D4UHL0_ADICA|nr:hypothetical protein GOP47_0016390 [Adiantum capillus-veneris]
MRLLMLTELFFAGSLQALLKPPEPFKLIDNPDAREVVLRRTFGVEDIEIVCVFHEQNFGQNDGEEEFGPPPPPDVPTKMVQMTIKISVGSDQPFLQIVCCAYGNKSSIEQVLLRNHVVKLKEAPFKGPDTSLLSDKIKSGFVQYLEVRGINNELAKFLLKYVPQSTQQKNACWLTKVERFLKV